MKSTRELGEGPDICFNVVVSFAHRAPFPCLFVKPPEERRTPGQYLHEDNDECHWNHSCCELQRSFNDVWTHDSVWNEKKHTEGYPRHFRSFLVSSFRKILQCPINRNVKTLPWKTSDMPRPKPHICLDSERNEMKVEPGLAGQMSWTGFTSTPPPSGRNRKVANTECQGGQKSEKERHTVLPN